jgi:hypothetical protein
VIKSRRIKWSGHVACLAGEEKYIQGFSGGTFDGKRSLGWPRLIYGRIMLKQILSKQDGRAWTGLIWLSIWRTSGKPCEHGIETVRSIK